MSTNDASRTYSADHELALLLKAAARSGERLRIQAEGLTVELAVKVASDVRGIWDDYDPQAARKAWHSISGLLAEVDANTLVEELKLDREQSPS